VAFTDGMQFFHERQEDYPFRNDVVFCRRATAAEVADAAQRTGEAYVDGVFFTSFMIDSPTHLRWLMRHIADRGGRFEQRSVAGLAELAPYFDIIVNATGIAAREVARDPAVHAVRGQLIRVYAPHVRNFAMGSSGPGPLAHVHDTYVLPRPNGVVVCGGTHQKRREFMGVDPGDAAGIWERCCKLVPALKDPRTVKIDEWTGLRPAREGDVRLEAEALPPPPALAASRKRTTVIHCYGHGGCGWSLSYGCARDVVRLALTAAAETAAAGTPTAASGALARAGLAAPSPVAGPSPAIGASPTNVAAAACDLVRGNVVPLHARL
jgi:D-amino-acid oxidase